MWPTVNSPRTVTIHILDDDSLLNLFYLYRPAIFEGDEARDNILQFEGGKEWNREQWWYQLAHVCQRWRNLILGSASYLGLCLVCTDVTPVADMLAHSPPFPLVFDYSIYRTSKREQEELIFALKQHGRVRLKVSEAWYLSLLIDAIDEEYPVLEYLIMELDMEGDWPAMALTETLRAPHLRHLLLRGFSLPIRSRLLTSAVGLVTLALVTNNPMSYFKPNSLLQCLSFVPQLENLLISFSYPLPDSDVETQLAQHTPIVTSIMLHNLRWFEFGGASAYMEAVVRQVTAPRLERLQVGFFEEPLFSVPNLLQIINTTENLRFDCANFDFTKDLSVHVNLRAYDPYETTSTFRTFLGRPKCLLPHQKLQWLLGASPSTSRYLLWFKFLILLVKCSLQWSTSLSNTRRGTLMRPTSPTALSGANSLGRLAT
jgi:hypothetical protein